MALKSTNLHEQHLTSKGWFTGLWCEKGRMEFKSDFGTM
jgi:hypothetical protein